MPGKFETKTVKAIDIDDLKKCHTRLKESAECLARIAAVLEESFGPGAEEGVDATTLQGLTMNADANRSMADQIKNRFFKEEEE